jgi:hypothetical protein
MNIFCLPISDDDKIEVLLDSPSTTTLVKNVIRHVTDVLQEESRHSTAIGPELSKTNNPTAYYTAGIVSYKENSTSDFKLVKREYAVFKAIERIFSLILRHSRHSDQANARRKSCLI